MLLALVLVVMVSLPFLVRVTVRCARAQWDQIAEQRHPATAGPPIERVTRDLRRLRHQLEVRENRPGTTGKGMKMGAVRAAYVEVLCTACRQLDVTPPRSRGQLPPSLAEIYRVELELRSRGLDVRLPRVDQRTAA